MAKALDISEFYTEIGGSYERALDQLMAPQLIDKHVRKFATDNTYQMMIDGLESNDPEFAFRGAHSMKGVSGTLCFPRLFEASCVLTDLLRPDRTDGYKPLSEIDYDDAVEDVTRAYVEVLGAISKLD